MTTISTIVFTAATWMPRERPDRAVTVSVQRRTSALVPDLCWELDRKLSWCVYGETAILIDSYPLGVITASSAQHVKAAVIISVDPNQSQPEYEQGSTEPSISEVRLILTQPIRPIHRRGSTRSSTGNSKEALLSVSGVTVHSLAGVGCGCPDLLVGAEGQTFLVEVKDGEKRPSHRTLTPDQRTWIKRWTGSPVVVLLDAGKALAWPRRIAAAPSTFAGVFGRPDAISPLGA